MSEERRSAKTPQLMKLLRGAEDAPVNPILDSSFKEEVIRARENPQVNAPRPKDDGTAEINVTSELISEWLPKVMKRFGCCTCNRCTAEASVEAFETVKPVVVLVRNEADLKRAAQIKGEKVNTVLMSLTRICAKRNKLPKHKK